MKTLSGFNLIELLITISIIAIMLSFAIPIYSQHFVKVKRLEAETILEKLALAMEQYHITNDTYANATLAALHFPEYIAKNNYRLVIQSATNFNYQLLAIPQQKQAEKDPCGTLGLSATNEKSVSNNSKIEECW